MRQPWNRVVEVRSKGDQAEGLEYQFPCCEGVVFVSSEKIAAYAKAPTDEAINPAPQVCPVCPEIDPEMVVEPVVEQAVETDPTPSNVVPFKATIQ